MGNTEYLYLFILAHGLGLFALPFILIATLNVIGYALYALVAIIVACIAIPVSIVYAIVYTLWILIRGIYRICTQLNDTKLILPTL